MYYDLNPAGILAATAASMLVSFVWFSPKVFGNLWIKTSNWKPEELEESRKKGMGKKMGIQFFSTLVQATILNLLLSFAGLTGWKYGLHGGLLLSLGIILPETIGAVLYDKKSWIWLFVIAGNNLVSMSVMSMIIGSFM